MLWTAEEIDLEEDVTDIKEKLTPDERRYLLVVLHFFRDADLLVLENTFTNMMRLITLPEARLFYGLQAYIEGVHAQTYGLMFDKYVTACINNRVPVTGVSDEELSTRLVGEGNFIDALTTVKRKSEWARKFMDECVEAKPEHLARILLAFVIVEGVFFCGAFASIFWLKKRGLCPGLAKANEFISRDESQHLRFGALLYDTLRRDGHGCDRETLRAMMQEAIDIECEFVTQCLPVDLIGINASKMQSHVRFTANYVLGLCGEEKMYEESASPFDFMDLISLDRKTNFFEERVTEYSMQTIERVFATDVDF